MTVRYIFIALEVFLAVIFLIPLPDLNAGNIAGLCLSFVLLGVTGKWQAFSGLIKKLWSSGGGKALLITCGAVIAAGIVYVTVLSVKMYRAQEDRPEEPRVLVVLGCKVRGERPSRMLRRRLDTAYKVLCDHPETVCIVSGGKGSGESISEAEAMKRYLVDKGIDESRIIMEDRSVSTYENLKFSLKIMEERGLGKDLTIVTDGFHQYRAHMIAKELGAGEVTSYSAYTLPRFLPTYWVREWIGITHYFLLGD
ncbi:MAG: YdcF family protein [Ruminococcus sp.]|nr:YdcF family protein [Ruminococcus sp.]